jgi:outer membrane protein
MQIQQRTTTACSVACASMLALIAFAGALRADETPSTPDDATKAEKKSLVTGRLGLGALAFPRYSGGDAYQVWPVPLADLEFGDFAYIDYWQAGLYVAATKDKKLGLAIIASPRIGFNSSDGDRLAGMMDRKSSLEMGLSIDYAVGAAGGISLGYLHDVTGASNGGVVRLIGGRRFEITEHFGLDGYLEADWLSAKVANYYYGVGANEATATRPFFQPGSDTSFQLGLHFNYDFGRRSTILFGYEATVLGSTIADSPIVVTRLNNLLYLGYGWRFQ